MNYNKIVEKKIIGGEYRIDLEALQNEYMEIIIRGIENAM